MPHLTFAIISAMATLSIVLGIVGFQISDSLDRINDKLRSINNTLNNLK